MSLAFASLLVPSWFSNFFDYGGSNKGVIGLIDAIVLIVETPYAISVIIAVILHLTMPEIREASLDQEGTLTVGHLPTHTTDIASSTETGKPGPK